MLQQSPVLAGGSQEKTSIFGRDAPHQVLGGHDCSASAIVKDDEDRRSMRRSVAIEPAEMIETGQCALEIFTQGIEWVVRQPLTHGSVVIGMETFERFPTLCNECRFGIAKRGGSPVINEGGVIDEVEPCLVD